MEIYNYGPIFVGQVMTGPITIAPDKLRFYKNSRDSNPSLHLTLNRDIYLFDFLTKIGRIR